MISLSKFVFLSIINAYLAKQKVGDSMEFNSLLEWTAEGMRFSLFTPHVSTDHDGWWESFAGVAPASKTSKPATMETLYNGEFEQGLLELRVLTDRIDWIYGPIAGQTPTVPSIGPFREQLGLFIRGLNRWLNEYGCKYSRLAYATTILNETEGRESGYSELNNILPFIPLSNGKWQDFFLQFNKPMTTSVGLHEIVRINRLINFSVANFQMFAFSSGILSPLVKHFTRIEYDINTNIDDSNEFNKSDSLELIDYLTNIVDATKLASEV